MQQALKLHNEGKFSEAENLYRQILEVVPENPIVLNLLGLIAQSKNLHSQAIEYFERAIKQTPTNAEYFFNLAWSEERCHKYAEAVNDYNQALKLMPNIKEAHNALGNIYLKQGDKELAKNHFNQAVLLDENYAEALANLAMADNDLDRLSELEKRFPSEPLIPYRMALFYRNQNNTDLAYEKALKSAELFPDDDTFLLLGELCLQQNNLTQAKNFFTQALQINSHCVAALINLANMEEAPEQAESLYRQALNFEPRNADAHINYADYLYRNRRLIEALEEYRHSVILAPKKTEISNNLGIIQKDLGEYEEALGLFFNALFAEPQRKEYALNIAETLMLLFEKDKNKAKKIADNWYKKMPDNIFAKRMNEIMNQTSDTQTAAYSQELFDLFADNYEQVMENINYSLPQQMAKILSPVKGTIIDLGCGTGLLGSELKNEDNSLIGIDISKKMLELAKVKNIYKELILDDIIHYCGNLPHADWIVAADVFGYIGDLQKILTDIFPHALCFSVETDEKCKDFSLQHNGRYKHNPQYVKKLLQKCGYSDIVEHTTVLRTENGSPVKGAIFTAKEKTN